MERTEILLRGITKEMRGIEIGAWHTPIVAKRDGYNSMSLDIFPTEQLRSIARTDSYLTPHHIESIEDVDLVGPATEIGRLVEEKGLAGEIDYIVSSHNFEHLPDPVKFLQGCASALRPGGILCMAVPDRRAVFDYFRPWSTTADFLAAFAEKRTKPTPAQRLEEQLLHARRLVHGVETATWDHIRSYPEIYSLSDVKLAWKEFQRDFDNPEAPYIDTHCWQFTPSSCELILRDLHFLGLTSLSVQGVYGSFFNEFYVRLVNQPGPPTEWERTFYRRRNDLLHATLRENSQSPVANIPGEGSLI